MRKTYTIYINKRLLLDLRNITKGEAKGAMLVFKMQYNDNHVVCKCDQTNEIIDQVQPIKIHFN